MTSNSTIKNSLPVILLFGPTAVGKTELLCRLFSGSGEVVSADSLQVYRGFDIGSAKPSREVLSRLPHHLINIRDPREGFSAGDFVSAADSLVPEIQSRGRLPVLSGGTAFYLKNFLYGLPEVPPGGGETRERLNLQAEQEGLPALHKRLQEVDPVSAERIPMQNRVRIIRALEVWETTGRPLSSFEVPDTPRAGYRFLVIGLDRPREELEQRIRLRVKQMFTEGLLDEIRRILASGVPEDSPAMQGIGYREFLAWRDSGSAGTSQLEEQIVLHTRQYAKRQRTFFRSLPMVRWFHPREEDKIRTLVAEFAASSP